MKLINEKINKWILKDSSNQIQDANELIKYLANVLYEDYEPAKGPTPGFWERLNNWVENVDSESQEWTLFKFVPKIFFVGRHEFDTLFRVAFNEHILKWLIDKEDLLFLDSKFNTKISEAVQHTWFCPITDSLRINAFYHINKITSMDLRPDWKSIRKLGDPEKILDYINKNNIKRLVLIEDFVGSGTQMASAVDNACTLLSDFDVLVVPLIICPKGKEKANELRKKHSNVEFSPIIELTEKELINYEKCPDRPSYCGEVTTLTQNMKKNLNLDDKASKKNDYYGLFGFKDTGATVVMYSNCPNNSLPVLHHETENWDPLFPRSGRV